MSRSSYHKGRHGKSSGISLGHHDEGTAARTRPLSFDEIMSKREKKRKQFDDEKEVAIEDFTRNREISEVSKRDDGRSKDSSSGNKKHLLEEDSKRSSRIYKESTSLKDNYVDKIKDRRIRDSETKLKPQMDEDVKSKGRIEEKYQGRRKSDVRKSVVTENEVSNKHSRDFSQIDRHVDGSRGKFGRESKRKDRNVVDERHRDRQPTKKHDIRKGRDRETSDRKEKKELSKSRYEESKLKRRRSRSREGEERNRRSVSPLSKSQKRASYHSNEHGELSSHSNKGRSERQQSDTDRTKNMNNGSSGQHWRHGGSTSGLGGYSPRKRRSEAGVKTPSPPKRSPEKKSAKWDLAPLESQKTLSVSVPSNFQLPNKIVSVNIHELGAFPVPSITAKPFPEVSSSILLANKNNSVDPVQLTQATRPMRRLYVENIPASASEKAVTECLNNFLISSGVNHIKGTQPCISCVINKEKGQALVEFLTPEDASAALHFDGNFFSGSIIKVRRPKDFVELATGEPEKSMAAVETISNIVKDSPHKIFVGGISKTLSSEMIMKIASSFGQLKAYRFENSCHQNEPHAFLEYVDKSVTFRACAGLNGMKLGGQVLTVLQVYPNTSTLESNANRPFYGIPDHAKPLLAKPTQVLLLKNMFDPENFPSLSETEIEEVLEDVRLECARFGSVKSVNFAKYGSTPSSAVEVCEVHEEKAFTRSKPNLEFDVTNPKTDRVEEATELTIAKSNNGVEDDKHAHNTTGNESYQSGQIDNDASLETLPIKSVPKSQELAKQMSNDESGSASDKVIRNIHTKDSSEPLEVDSKLEQVGGDIKGKPSDAFKKGHKEEQDHNVCHHIVEAGCVFVEFRRAEASCAAAHCLHGRLFDNRTVTVGYVPLDVYLSRFPK